MRYLHHCLLPFLLSLLVLPATAQKKAIPPYVMEPAGALAGEWKGSFIVQSEVIKCDVNIFPEGNAWKATIDFPERGRYDITYTLTRKGNQVELKRTIDSSDTHFTYTGVIQKDVITGTYTYRRKDYSVSGVFQWMQNPSRLTRHQALPPFHVTLEEGGVQVTNTTFKGKYLLLDFWMTTCKECVPKRPVLEEAQQRYAGQPFEILSIALDGKAQVASFRKEQSPMAWKNAVLEEKWKASLVKTFGIDKIGLPTTLLISPDGKILAVTDMLTKETLLTTLANYLPYAKK